MVHPTRLAVSTAAAMLLLAAVSSCVPVRGGGSGYRVSVAIPDADRSLLQQLALADPLAKPATGPALASPLSAPPPFLAAVDTDDGHRAEDCLTAAVYYEARSEPIDGQRAVAQVVLNRVRDRAFPASVCGVVYQRSARVCQFTFACDGSTAHAIQPRAWAIARAIADAALAGSIYAPVGSATHYHANYVSPWWAPSLTRVAAVGSHIFYRWHDHLADALSFRQAYSGHEGSVTVAAAGAADASGVRIMRGGDGADTGGINIHRGVDGPDVPAASGNAFGVRIHRTAGDVAPPLDGAEQQASPDVDQH